MSLNAHEPELFEMPCVTGGEILAISATAAVSSTGFFRPSREGWMALGDGMKLRPLSKVRTMPYVYQEYPKWIAGLDVIVQKCCGRALHPAAMGTRQRPGEIERPATRPCRRARLGTRARDFGTPGARQQLSRNRPGAQRMRPALA